MLIRKRNVSFLCDVFSIVKKKYLDQSSLSLKHGVYSANDLGFVRSPGDVGELDGGGGGSRPEHKVKPRWCWSKGIRSCASDDNGT